ncbi:hypothetical protein AVEN_40569-1 [Araneus ventricosus]|uniref:Uncharacterized protein n=1 Tax=Araneus ventricosus TaxID=182803 RepID=A0A4Y2L8W5_ARAVE|nr:hypothetical protein AVEN_40569-1 [Araneus ventricosus]
MKSVFRRPDLRSQRPKSIFSPQENRALDRLCPLPKKLSLHPRSSPFNPPLLPTGVRSRKSLHESPSILLGALRPQNTETPQFPFQRLEKPPPPLKPKRQLGFLKEFIYKRGVCVANGY